MIATAAECFSAAVKALSSSGGSSGAAAAKHAATKIVNEVNTSTPAGCSILAVPHSKTLEIVFNSAVKEGARASAECGEQAALKVGSVTSFVNTTIQLNVAAAAASSSSSSASLATAATITMVGPAASWFGVGFGGVGMKGTYAIVVDGKDAKTRYLYYIYENPWTLAAASSELFRPCLPPNNKLQSQARVSYFLIFLWGRAGLYRKHGLQYFSIVTLTEAIVIIFIF